MSLVFAEHYSMKQLRSWEDVEPLIARDRGAADLNWLFLATSGVHGSYLSLDEREKDSMSTTILIVQPRLVCMFWGNLEIPAKDELAMRQWVRWTIDAVITQARGNI